MNKKPNVTDTVTNQAGDTAFSSAIFLAPEALTANIPASTFSFADTSALIQADDQTEPKALFALQHAAKAAAEFGLAIGQSGFNIVVLGEAGTGRKTLMQHVAKAMPASAEPLRDLLAINQRETQGQVQYLKLPAGHGLLLKKAVDQFVAELSKLAAAAPDDKVTEAVISTIQSTVETSIKKLQTNQHFKSHAELQAHFEAFEKDLLDYLKTWQGGTDAAGFFETLMSDALVGRYRVNLLVHHAAADARPVITDDDPSLCTLFGGVDGANDLANAPEFMRLRAGNLLRADGGVLMLNLRDILADETNGPLLLEKLQRFCRNGTLQIEDLSGGQGGSLFGAQAPVATAVKIVLLATREDYYALNETDADLFNLFPIKVECAECVKASDAYYQAFARFVAEKCEALNGTHFTAAAVSALLLALHRVEEDQVRLSTSFAVLEKLIVESMAVAMLDAAEVVDEAHVKAAIAKRDQRHSYIEGHMRESIIDQELMINVDGTKIGQINGLTHIDLADASFGSPICISANCYAGAKGVLNIDRDVAMSGPTHDKGVMIMQSWLQQHFCQFNPLNFTASLVFEQEYTGVDGDSASCAELFALMSSLAQLPINQSIAVTGAMNQHGEVLPVGGLNDKIAGYYSVCKAIGFNGKQGVLIPSKNARHLMLNEEVVAAVKAGQFHIATMSRVEEGLMHLMQCSMETVNAHAIARLQAFKAIIEQNQPVQQHKH